MVVQALLPEDLVRVQLVLHPNDCPDESLQSLHVSETEAFRKQRVTSLNNLVNNVATWTVDQKYIA